MVKAPREGYFNRTRSELFGKPLAELEPKGQERVRVWRKVEVAYDTLNGCESSGAYFMGDFCRRCGRCPGSGGIARTNNGRSRTVRELNNMAVT